MEKENKTINNIVGVELVDLSSIPYNINCREYFLIDLEHCNAYDVFYYSPNELRSKIENEKANILIKIKRKTAQKS